jgi:hypothetical protein
VELDKFHVSYFCPGSVGHGYTVSCGHIRVAGVDIHFASTAGTEQSISCQTGEDTISLNIENVCSPAALLALGGPQPPLEQVAFDNQIDGNMVFKNRNVGMVFGHGNQNSLHLPASHVLGMDDAATGMPTFASEIERDGILLTRLKAYTHFG